MLKWQVMTLPLSNYGRMHETEQGLTSHQTYCRSYREQVFMRIVGLDRYRAGARYAILSAAAILIPILGCTNFFLLKM